MTHELRTPLNGIIGYLEILDETKEHTERINLINQIRLSSNNLLSIVNEILEFSKIEKNEITLNYTNKEIYSVLENCYKNFVENAKNKNIKYEWNNFIEKNIFIKIDYMKFIQVMNNLLSNSFKYTNEGRIVLTSNCERIEGNLKLIIELKDSGIGVNENELVSIFNPYVQSSKSKNTNIVSTGLGLSITKEYVELMNGKINCTLNQGEGLTFSFFIICPIVGKIGLNEKNNEKNNEKKYDHLNILIVEDNDINIKIFEMNLKKLNIKYKSVYNGLEAIKELELNEGIYDIVLMDKQMPEMDGIEATKKIRMHQSKNISSIYIIGQSANWENGFDVECIENDMNASLSKPLLKAHLIKALDRYIETTIKKAA